MPSESVSNHRLTFVGTLLDTGSQKCYTLTLANNVKGAKTSTTLRKIIFGTRNKGFVDNISDSNQIKQIIDHYGADLKLDADSFVCIFRGGDKPKFNKVVFNDSTSKKLLIKMINMNSKGEDMRARPDLSY
uniref:LAGLIDADG homing endonuclease n=1 Tax=Romanomermis culicivorax TaxID=13658 RepID=A0A915IE29_ROMCU